MKNGIENIRCRENQDKVYYDLAFYHFCIIFYLLVFAQTVMKVFVISLTTSNSIYPIQIYLLMYQYLQLKSLLHRLLLGIVVGSCPYLLHLVYLLKLHHLAQALHIWKQLQ